VYKFNQLVGRLEKPKQPIRSHEILKFWRAINERTLIGRKKVGISKKREKNGLCRSSKMSTVNIQLKQQD